MKCNYDVPCYSHESDKTDSTSKQKERPVTYSHFWKNKISYNVVSEENGQVFSL